MARLLVLAPSLHVESMTGWTHPWGFYFFPPGRQGVFIQWPQGCNLGEKPASKTDGVPATPVSPDTTSVSLWGTLQLPHPDIINSKETRPGMKGNFSSINRKVLLIRPNERESVGVYENLPVFELLEGKPAS